MAQERVEQLEAELGTALFRRHTRGLVLTPTGQFFYEHALQILEKVDTTVAATRRLPESSYRRDTKRPLVKTQASSSTWPSATS